MFNTLEKEWINCMQTCRKYNRAQGVSFTDKAGLDELITWSLETTIDPITQETLEYGGMSWWMPFR